MARPRTRRRPAGQQNAVAVPDRGVAPIARRTGPRGTRDTDPQPRDAGARTDRSCSTPDLLRPLAAAPYPARDSGDARRAEPPCRGDTAARSEAGGRTNERESSADGKAG